MKGWKNLSWDIPLIGGFENRVISFEYGLKGEWPLALFQH